MMQVMSSVRAAAISASRRYARNPRVGYSTAKRAAPRPTRLSNKKEGPPRDGPSGKESGKVFNVIVGTVGTGLAVSLVSKSREEVPIEIRAAKTDPNLEAVLKEVDTLYDGYLIDNAYGILRRYETSENTELLWRLARVLCEKAKLSKDKKQREELFLESHRIALRALEFEPAAGSFGAHKWFAIILNYVGEVQGSKAQIQNSYHVRNHLERALEIRNNDPTTWHILGAWHFTFADMPSYQRYAAKAFFDTPPTSTYEDALYHFEKAEKLQPGFYSQNTFYLAETLDRLGRKDEAKEAYIRAFRARVVTADDQAVHTKSHAKLKKLGVKDTELVGKK